MQPLRRRLRRRLRGRPLDAPLVAGLLTWLVGASCAGPAAPHRGAFSFTLENDTFTGSDNNYSNGIGLSWATAELEAYDEGSLVRRWADLWGFLPFVGEPEHDTYATWTLGQEMHTPDDIEDPNPPLDDQPYAGILYLDSSLHARGARWGHVWTLRLGIVGPSSRADQVQTEFHEIIDDDKPLGWDTQLPDEPVVNVNYTAGWIWREGELGTASWRVVPLAGAGLGNYFTGLGLGAYGELGWNLADALAGSALRSGLDTVSVVGAGPQDGWTFSLFAGVGGYAVAQYLPLSGTVFRNSRSVDANPLIGTVTAGMALRHKRLVLGLSQTHFTETFDSLRDDADFGTITMSWYF